MGRGAFFIIKNQSAMPLDVSFTSNSEMKREAGAKFEPLTRTFGPNEEAQSYLESDNWIETAHFDMLIHSGGRQVGKLRFSASLLRYELQEKQRLAEELDFSVECGSHDRDIDRVVISFRDTNEKLAGFSLWRLYIRGDGGLVDAQCVDSIANGVNQEQLTDLVIIAHGINNSPEEAINAFRHYFEKVSAVMGEVGAGRKLGVVAVFWPTKQTYGEDDSLISKIQNFSSYLSAPELVARVGEGMAHFLRKLRSQVNGSTHIHLAAHSLGTAMLSMTMRQHSGDERPWASTAFLIQSPVTSASMVPVPGAGAAIADRTVATCAPNDETISSVGSLLKITGARLLGLVGFDADEHVGRIRLAPGTRVTSGDYQKPLTTLDAEGVIGNHNDYKREEVARAHLAAMGIG